MKVSEFLVSTGRASEEGHWYLPPDGAPVYEIQAKAGHMRPATLRDARKLGLVPGYSTIAKTEHKDFLVRWKINQAIESALTLPMVAGESMDARKQRVITDSQEQARKAAELGTAIHAAIEASFQGQPFDILFARIVAAVQSTLLSTYGKRSWVAERSFAHPLGFGGKVDLCCQDVVIDFKTKDFGEDKPPADLAFPESHCMQLAAYSQGLGMPNALCANLFISTTVPGLVRLIEWTAEDCALQWRCFQWLLANWQDRKQYYCNFKAA